MSEVEFIGNIDEAGFLKNFSRQGFSIPKCLNEAVANSLDAMQPDQDKRIHFQQTKDNILMIDNAIGMNSSNLRDMYAAHFENHSSHKSKGVSGIGGKIAQYHLSRKTQSTLLTHQKGGAYLKVYAPWEEMMKKGKYSSMFKRVEMTKEEIKEFNAERFDMFEEGEEPVGTTIVFPYNDPLYESILENFERSEDKKYQLDVMDRIPVVFGREQNLRITAELDGLVEGYKEMEFYNYFGGKAADYYDGIDRQSVHLYVNHAGDSRFIWKKTEDQEYEIPKIAKGFSKELKKRTKSLDGYSFEGEYEIVTGLRKQEGVNPRDITGEKVIGSYDLAHIGENDQYLAYYKVVRTDQGIGLIEPEVKIGNARANKQSNLKIYLVQTEVCFSPLSSQDSIQDQITGVQQNKNQFNGKNVPKNLTRLLYKIREEKCKSIEKFLGLSNKQNPTPSLEDSQSEKENLSDSEQTAPLILDEINLHSDTEYDADASSLPEEDIDFKPNLQSPSSDGTDIVVQEQKEQQEEQQEEQQVEQQEEQRSRIPIDVVGHRKGCVRGEEMINELNRIVGLLSADNIYTDVEVVELFNRLRSFKK